MTQACAEEAAATGVEVLVAATGTEEDSQSAQVEESVLTGSTYLVVVLVDAIVMVVVASSELQSAQVDVLVVAGSTGVTEDQSAQVS